MKTKEPIRLRQRKMPSGLTSLYLDIYVEGRRSYEYLKLYLIPATNKAERDKNRETLQLAETICAKRLVEFRNGQYGFGQKGRGAVRFFDYFLRMAESRKRTDSMGNWYTWHSCLVHLKNYEKDDDLTFGHITKDWIKGFKQYLDHEAVAYERRSAKGRSSRPLSQNSKASYFNTLATCIHQALKDGIITSDPLMGVDGFAGEGSTRMYLTVDEVRRLAATECDFPVVKEAFLYSCLTGLRRSDIERLKWGNVHRQGDYTRIIYRQKKTGGQEYLDIAPEAVELMGEPKDAESLVFPYIHEVNHTSEIIRKWVAKAGIQKDITFHCGRHTFATMMLDLGTDIYTVSKLLGHREIATTQIYAKVMDKAKQAAVQRIPSILALPGEEKAPSDL